LLDFTSKYSARGFNHNGDGENEKKKQKRERGERNLKVLPKQEIDHTGIIVSLSIFCMHEGGIMEC